MCRSNNSIQVDYLSIVFLLVKEEEEKGTLTGMALSWWERFLCRVAQQGPIPSHVAFIMDGNRRWAEKRHIERTQGHREGYGKLEQALEWCVELGIKTVTVYAFSIENFKRSVEEVEALMTLAREKFTQIVHEADIVSKFHVCVRVLGDVTRLPTQVQQAMARAEKLSRGNNGAFLNVCFSYTSREEITRSVREICKAVERGELLPSDATEDLLVQCLDTGPTGDVDLLVRTSGETRLSDFMLWQSSFSVLSFVSTLWPDLTILDLLGSVLAYQHRHQRILAERQMHACHRDTVQEERDRAEVLATLRKASPDDPDPDPAAIEVARQQRVEERNARVTLFLDRFMRKHDARVDMLCAEFMER